MTVNVSVTRSGSMWKNLTEDKIKAGLKEVNRGALKIHSVMVRSFVTSKGGRTYTRGSISHIASAPGEAPARDTGFLGQSIVFKLVPIAVSSQYEEAQVVATAPYAAALEFGREDGTMAARPFMRPAFNDNIADIRKNIESALGGK